MTSIDKLIILIVVLISVSIIKERNKKYERLSTEDKIINNLVGLFIIGLFVWLRLM
jgi:hypothetical protein